MTSQSPPLGGHTYRVLEALDLQGQQRGIHVSDACERLQMSTHMVMPCCPAGELAQQIHGQHGEVGMRHHRWAAGAPCARSMQTPGSMPDAERCTHTLWLNLGAPSMLYCTKHRSDHHVSVGCACSAHETKGVPALPMRAPRSRAFAAHEGWRLERAEVHRCAQKKGMCPVALVGWRELKCTSVWWCVRHAGWGVGMAAVSAGVCR